MKHRAETIRPTSTRERADTEVTSGLADLIGYDAVLAITASELDDLIYGLGLYQPTSGLLADLCAATGRNVDTVVRCATGLYTDRVAAEQVPA